MPPTTTLPAFALVSLLAVTALPARAETVSATAGNVVGVELAPPVTTAAPAPGAPVTDVPLTDASPAAPAPDAARPVFKRRPFIVLAGGPGFASVAHPQLGTPRIYGPLLAAEVGYAVSRYWSFGVEATNLERSVARVNAAERFGAASSWLHTEASCTSCAPPPPGGPVVQLTMLLDTVGPRVDFTPFGHDGLFFGASGGVAIITVLDARVGAGGALRAGFRLPVADVLTFGVEGGVQGQVYSGASATIGYGALTVTLAMVNTPSKAGNRMRMPVSQRAGTVSNPGR